MIDEVVPAPFAIRCAEDGDTLVVSVAGELDIASEGQLLAVMDRRHAGIRSIVIDMAELDFMDARGLSDLVSMDAAARPHRVTVTVRSSRPHIRKLFVITGLGYFLDD